MNIRAKVKSVLTSNMNQLERYVPPDPDFFSISVRAMVGPEGSDGEESFDVQVCTLRWLEDRLERELFVLGTHRLFVKTYDQPEIRKFITRTIERFSGSTWQEVAEKIGRQAHWEFEDYKPAGGTDGT